MAEADLQLTDVISILGKLDGKQLLNIVKKSLTRFVNPSQGTDKQEPQKDSSD